MWHHASCIHSRARDLTQVCSTTPTQCVRNYLVMTTKKKANRRKITTELLIGKRPKNYYTSCSRDWEKLVIISFNVTTWPGNQSEAEQLRLLSSLMACSDELFLLRSIGTFTHKRPLRMQPRQPQHERGVLRKTRFSVPCLPALPLCYLLRIHH